VGDWELGFYHRRLLDTPDFTITKAMLRNAGIGRSYWQCTIDKIPDARSYKSLLAEMITNLPTDEALGKGVILFGKHGYGKTSAAMILLKSAMARGGQVFHRMASTVEHAYQKRWVETNRDGVEVWDLLTKCQLLSLDDLGNELASAGYKAGDTRIVEELIRERYDDRLTTYITTNLSMQELVKRYPSIGSILFDPKRFHIIEVSGHNWRRGEED